MGWCDAGCDTEERYSIVDRDGDCKLAYFIGSERPAGSKWGGGFGSGRRCRASECVTDGGDKTRHD